MSYIQELRNFSEFQRQIVHVVGVSKILILEIVTYRSEIGNNLMCIFLCTTRIFQVQKIKKPSGISVNKTFPVQFRRPL